LSNYAIQVEGLGKEYIIGGAEQRHDSFREMLTGALTSPLRKLRKLGGTASEEERFWALKDVSFNVEQGEVLGIIGRNGAGKSTLLKVLSRITSPTEGRVVTRGRVASLLEVGTGFHPELTGRENIFLNGAILGMSQRDIDRRFDEIVQFAGIERFVDTPVKRYSSGMHVRLAFSVAAHLDPEVLIIDEVLAVGDAEFQQRCLGRMRETASGGRTVLFVSHNLSVLQQLCPRSILMDRGELVTQGTTSSVIALYRPPPDVREETPHFENKDFVIRGLEITCDQNEGRTFGKNDAIAISFAVTATRRLDNLHLGYALYSASDRPLWWSFFGDCTGRIGLDEGTTVLRTVIPAYLLNDGEYIVEIIGAYHRGRWVMPPEHRDCFASFCIRGGAMGNVLVSNTNRPGFMFPLFPWTIELSACD